MNDQNKEWLKYIRDLVDNPWVPIKDELRRWLKKRLIVEDKLSEKQKKDLFEVADFLILDNELKNQKKKQLTPKDNQLLDSVETILNDCLKRLKKIKGE
ncbi:hypothetical protein [Planktothrix agardhii]|uniref:hypothetical protein n=1 Tax=Planktothrix agardhii TaxID=1160 RepID=UPI0020B363B9|nr:hypothetical protein [Planktothrix agardhii]MCP9294520.1 hypothetical protein [Planktothrix agardhii LY1]CAD5954485.1 hypothetical protein PCC7811_02757 [Planktothrix agardhii]